MASSSSTTYTEESEIPNIDTDNPVYFWKPEEANGYLGQWFPSDFVNVMEDGTEVEYRNCEQYMMHQKGLLFAPDDEVTSEILSKTVSPRTMRTLGRQIPNFDEESWRLNRFRIVVDANYLKFTQNEQLQNQLLATSNRQLVEASPRDRIWGIGFGAKNARSRRINWGLNLLGKALMIVRERIRQEQAANH